MPWWWGTYRNYLSLKDFLKQPGGQKRASLLKMFQGAYFISTYPQTFLNYSVEISLKGAKLPDISKISSLE